MTVKAGFAVRTRLSASVMRMASALASKVRPNSASSPPSARRSVTFSATRRSAGRSNHRAATASNSLPSAARLVPRSAPGAPRSSRPSTSFASSTRMCSSNSTMPSGAWSQIVFSRASSSKLKASVRQSAIAQPSGSAMGMVAAFRSSSRPSRRRTFTVRIGAADGGPRRASGGGEVAPSTASRGVDQPTMTSLDGPPRRLDYSATSGGREIHAAMNRSISPRSTSFTRGVASPVRGSSTRALRSTK